MRPHNRRMDDLAALEAAIYDQSFRALDEQLDECRRVDPDRDLRVRLTAAAAPQVDDGSAAA